DLASAGLRKIDGHKGQHYESHASRSGGERSDGKNTRQEHRGNNQTSEIAEFASEPTRYGSVTLEEVIVDDKKHQRHHPHDLSSALVRIGVFHVASFLFLQGTTITPSWASRSTRVSAMRRRRLRQTRLCQPL